MGWVADDFAAWLLGLLADAGRRKLTEFLVGTEFERALLAAGTAAVEATATELSPNDEERAAHLARVISEVFAVPALHLATAPATVLEAVHTGIAVQIAVLEDPSRTTVPGLSWAAEQGIGDGVIAAALTRRLLAQIISRAAGGTPLTALAAQLNTDLAYLQGAQTQGMLSTQHQQVTAMLSQLAEEIRASNALSSRAAELAAGSAEVSEVSLASPPGQARPEAMARLVDTLRAPPVPCEFTARPDEYGRVRDLLLGPLPAWRGHVIALAGMSGAGKTVLAAAIAADKEVCHRFRGGVLWLRLAPEAPPRQGLDLMLTELGAKVPREPGDAVALLRSLLAGTRCLIIADNAGTAEQIEMLAVADQHSALLVTTQNMALPKSIQTISVGRCSPSASRALLENYSGQKLPASSPEVSRVLGCCDGLALALAICGARAGDSPTGARQQWGGVADMFEEAFDRLAAAGLLGEYEHPSLPAALEAGICSLPAEDQSLYRGLAVFAGRGLVPVSAAGMLWGLGMAAAQQKVEYFASRSLVTYQAGRRGTAGGFRLHELLARYLTWRAGSGLPALHWQLAGAFLDSWGGTEAGLPGADPGDSYGVTYLADHLRRARRPDVLHQVLAAERPEASGRMQNTWFAVHDQAGPDARYLADLSLARQLAEQATDSGATAAERGRSRALEMRYALARSSATAITARVPPPLMAALVDRGVWSFENAWTHAAKLASPPARAAALAALARLPDEFGIDRGQLLAEAREAADALTGGMDRAWALARLIPCAPDPARRDLFEAVMRVTGEDQPSTGKWRPADTRAWILIRLAPHLPSLVSQRYNDIKRGMHGIELLMALLLAAPGAPGLRGNLAETAHDMRQYAWPSLIARAIPWVAEEHKPQLIADEHDVLLRPLARAAPAPRRRRPSTAFRRRRRRPPREEDKPITPVLPAGEGIALLKKTVLEMRDDHETQAWLLVALLPLVPETEQSALAEAAAGAFRQAAGKLDHEHLKWVVPGLPEAYRVRLAADVARDGSDYFWRMLAVARYLPEDSLVLVIDQACAQDDFRRNQAFESLAPWLPEKHLRHALRALPGSGTRSADGMDTPEDRARVLTRLASRMPREQHTAVVEAIAAVSDADQRTTLLAQAASHLDAAQTKAVLAAIPSGAEPDSRAVVLTRLAMRNQGATRAALLSQARTAASSSENRTQPLRELPGLAHDPWQLSSVLMLRRLLEGTPGQARVPDPAHLASRLPPGAFAEAIRIARQEMPGACDRARALAGLVTCTTGTLRATLLKEALDAACARHDHSRRTDYCSAYNAIKTAMPCVPGHERLGLPAGYLSQVRAAAGPPSSGRRRPGDDHRDADQRIRQLACVLMYLPEGKRKDAAAEAIRELRRPRPEHDQERWLTALAPFLPFDHGEEAAALIEALTEHADRAGPLTALARGSAEPQRTALLERARDAASHETSGSPAIAGLASLLPPAERAAFLSEALDRIATHGNSEAKAAGISLLAPLLPAQLTDKAARIAGTITMPAARAEARRALASTRDATSPAGWRLWRSAITDAVAADRTAVLEAAVDACLAASGDVPGKDTEPVAAHLGSAILDTLRWWPGSSQPRITGPEAIGTLLALRVDELTRDDSDYETWMSDYSPRSS